MNRLEAAKNYLVSVAQRTVGLEAARKYYAESKPTPDDPNFKFARRVALITGSAGLVVQAIMPLVGRYMINTYHKSSDDKGHWYYDYQETPLRIAGFGAGLVTDLALLGVTLSLSVTHSPLEVAEFKLAANAVSHVGADIIEATVNKIRSIGHPVPL